MKEEGNKIQLGKNKDYNLELQDNPIPHFEIIQMLFEILKTDLIDLSFLVNDQERKTTFLYSNQMVKAFNSKTKSSLNHLKQICTT